MNAFSDILGGVGRAADAVLLGGAVGKSNRRNKFADYLEGGQYDEAARFAARQGEGGYAQLAQQQGRLARQDEEEDLAQLGRIAGYGDSITDPEMRAQYAEDVISLFGYDEEDANQIRLAAQQERGFGTLYQAYVGGDQGQESFGVTPQFVRQPDGSVRAVQFGNRGTVKTQDAGGVPIPLELRAQSNDLAGLRLQQGYDLASPELRGAQAQATAVGKAAGEIQGEDLPRSNRAARAAENVTAGRSQRIKLVSDTINKAIQQSNKFNTGPVAGRNPFATNLQATLDTIAANIGFEELQRLRDNSPTGGALGQVSERENVLLQSVLGAIGRAQNEKQLDENLRRAKQEIIASWNRVADAYERDYGRPYAGTEPSSEQPRSISDYTDEELEAIANGSR